MDIYFLLFLAIFGIWFVMDYSRKFHIKNVYYEKPVNGKVIGFDLIVKGFSKKPFTGLMVHKEFVVPNNMYDCNGLTNLDTKIAL